jgi:hypothetical protein
VKRIATVARRAVGGALVVLVVIPFWRLLSSSSAPVAREAIRLTDFYSNMMVQGTGVVLVLAAVIALLASPDAFERLMRKVGTQLCSWGGVRYALVLAVVSGALTCALSWYVWSAKPVLIDALAQFVHARFLAEWLLAAPAGLPYEFWVVSNTFVTDQGWLSQYPPGHIVALAFGFVVGAVWLICPLLMAVTTAFTSLAAERLFPEDRAVARLGALLFAVSPLLISLAAANMSHVTVAALIAVTAYFALRARDESWVWAIAAGVAVGAAFATRPLSAVVLGSVVTVGVWLTGSLGQERPWQYMGMRTAAAFVGALPPVLAVAGYNARFFGSPFSFGYTAYFGPNHGLGFHPDPLGNPFGPAEGLAYTSSDLAALGYFLLRTPVSVVLVVGLFLVLAQRLSQGIKLVTAWALVLTVPLGLYWHHDLMLGPRMISESAPAWCLLVAAAGLGLVRMVPAERLLAGGRFSPRVFVGASLAIALVVGFGFFLPLDVRRYAQSFAAPVSPVRSDFPALVFVHGSWDGRTVARLLGSGMRADSVSVALSRNSSCRMHEFATAYVDQKERRGRSELPPLEFGFASTDGSEPMTLPTGVVIRARPDEQLAPECQSEAASDRGGTIPLMPLLWQGDLPGIRGAGAMFVRDLGPSANAELIARYPRRRVGVLYRRIEDGVPVLVPYAEGMRALWGDG